MRLTYRFRKADGDWTVLESTGHPHLSPELSLSPSLQFFTVHRGFFVMARPYFNKNRMLFDPLLECQVESERVRTRVAELKNEEKADQAIEGQEQKGSRLFSLNVVFEDFTYEGSGSLGDTRQAVVPQSVTIISNAAPNRL